MWTEAEKARAKRALIQQERQDLQQRISNLQGQQERALVLDPPCSQRAIDSIRATITDMQERLESLK